MVIRGECGKLSVHKSWVGLLWLLWLLFCSSAFERPPPRSPICVAKWNVPIAFLFAFAIPFSVPPVLQVEHYSALPASPGLSCLATSTTTLHYTLYGRIVRPDPIAIFRSYVFLILPSPDLQIVLDESGFFQRHSPRHGIPYKTPPPPPIPPSSHRPSPLPLLSNSIPSWGLDL